MLYKYIKQLTTITYTSMSMNNTEQVIMLHIIQLSHQLKRTANWTDAQLHNCQKFVWL